MTFEGLDAAFPIEFGLLPQARAMAPADGTTTLEAALRAAGLAETMMAEGDMVDRRAAREPLTVLDLPVDARSGGPSTAFDPWGGAAVGKAGDEPRAGPDPTIMTPGGTPPPGGYVDSNGNGQYDPGEEQVIVVNGRRPNEVDEGGGSEDGGWPWEPNPGNDAGGGTPGDGGVGGAPPPGDEDGIAQKVTLDPSIPADQRERAEEAERKLEEEMRKIDQLIQALDDNEVVTVGDKSYTGAEIKALWATMTYIITWSADFGPLGTAINNNGQVSVNLDVLEIILTRNGQIDMWGADDMLFHELAHLLPADRANYQTQWQAYLNSGGNPSVNHWQYSSYFQAAEAYTNAWKVVIGPWGRRGGFGPGSY